MVKLVRKEIVLVAFCLLVGIARGAASESAAGLPVDGYELIWSDEFAGTELDRTKWDYRQLGKRRNAINVKDTVALDGAGNLVLSTKRVGDAIHTAMIGTQGKFETTYGYFECRVKMQKTHGNWSAFWLQAPKLGSVLGDTKVSGTEIDIYECFEVRNGWVSHNLHWDGYSKDHKHRGSGHKQVANLTEGYHTFGLEWTPRAYRFFVDGKESWRSTEAISGTDEYIILSLEVGPKQARVAGESADFVDRVLFDYVRVYQKKAAPKKPADLLKVLSYNIRYGSARDGANAWEKRKEFVVETMKAYDPDLLGTQEVEAFQAAFLAEKLPGYGFVGVGRDDGKKRGEFSAIFYRRSRFEKVAEGHFWLSETPAVAGSKSWDSSLPRMASWVKLRPRDRPGTVLHFFNTHFDHRGAVARAEGARVIRERISALGAGAAVIVTGDFNTAPGSRPHQVLLAPPASGVVLKDAYQVMHKGNEEGAGTFHGFRGTPSTSRIDWILYSGRFEPLSATIERTNKDGRYPSDHFPVTAVLRLKAE